MKLSDNSKNVISKLEIAIAALLFFVMLIFCGMYIDVKLNGKISNLPPLSENDTKMLLRSSVTDDASYTEDLLEPVFIGVKNEGKMSAVLPSDLYRRSFEEMIYDNVAFLFEGTSKQIEFDSQEKLRAYIQQKKDGNRYILIGFYSDIPSDAVLPCILNNPRTYSEEQSFLFKYLFFLPDSDNNLFACAISENYTVTELYAGQAISFDKILNESYDVSEGFVRFGYSESSLLRPVYLDSFRPYSYRIDSLAKLLGKEHDSDWVENLFDVFSLNGNLVRSFSSGDHSEINHVDESRELVINDDGMVVFKALDAGVVLLDEYLGFISDSDNELSFSDKIYVLKKIINRTVDTTYGVSYSLSGINYDETENILKIYFKYMTDGIFLYDTPFDAVFEMRGNELVYAKLMAVKCTPDGASDVVLPQKYADVVGTSEAVDTGTFLVLEDTGEGITKTVDWGYIPLSQEVKE